MRSCSKFLVAGAALLLVAGCSSSDSGDDPGTTSTSTSTSTSASASTPSTAGSPDVDPALVDAISDGLEARNSIAIGISFTPEQATCTAPLWAGTLQAPLETAGIGSAELAEPSFSPTDLDLEVDQGYELVDAMVACDVPAYDTYLQTLSGGLDEQQTGCPTDAFDDDLTRRFLAESLTMPSVSAELKADLDGIYAECGID